MPDKTPLELAEMVTCGKWGDLTPEETQRVCAALIARMTPVEMSAASRCGEYQTEAEQIYECPKCHGQFPWADTANFCPNCGRPITWK